ncbi:Uncharacterised protein [uncultured Comamonas sp.]|nr:Uncharacterised protein [uncultured Comamonas sp.]
MEGSYYQESSEEPTLVLKPNGKAVFMGMMEYPYEVEGKDVKLLTPEGTVILEGKEDGSLLSMFGKLKKRPS